jgi:hypothetical protein
VLIIELPPEEGQEFYTSLQQAGLEIVLLALLTILVLAYQMLNKLRKYPNLLMVLL